MVKSVEIESEPAVRQSLANAVFFVQANCKEQFCLAKFSGLDSANHSKQTTLRLGVILLTEYHASSIRLSASSIASQLYSAYAE